MELLEKFLDDIVNSRLTPEVYDDDGIWPVNESMICDILGPVLKEIIDIWFGLTRAKIRKTIFITVEKFIVLK
jgi:hypothetical protein